MHLKGLLEGYTLQDIELMVFRNGIRWTAGVIRDNDRSLDINEVAEEIDQVMWENRWKHEFDRS